MSEYDILKKMEQAILHKQAEATARKIWADSEIILGAYGMLDWDLTESKRQLFRSRIVDVLLDA